MSDTDFLKKEIEATDHTNKGNVVVTKNPTFKKVDKDWIWNKIGYVENCLDIERNPFL